MGEEKTRDQGRYLIRFPERMRERLERAAELNSRSLNAEIIARLERTLGDNAVDEFDTLLSDKAIKYSVRKSFLETLASVGAAFDEAAKSGKEIKFYALVGSMRDQLEQDFSREIEEDAQSLADGMSKKDVAQTRRRL